MNQRRSIAAILVIVLTASVVIGSARFLKRMDAPRSDGDLGAPVLFDRNELRARDVVDEEPGGIAVLCYHYFGPGLTAGRLFRVLGAVLLNLPTIPDRDYWTTTVPEFENQMRWLADEGYVTLTLDQLMDHLSGRRPAPERSVVLTIDDGDRTFVEHAVPVLRRHGFTATLFLLSGRAGEKGWNDLDLVDWQTLRGLEEEGVVRVESHSHRMHNKIKTGRKWTPRFLVECRDEFGEVSVDSPLGHDLLMSRAAVREQLGHECRYLAWPFGFGVAPVDSLAHAAGFQRIFTLSPHRNRLDSIETPVTHPGDTLGRFAVTARTSFRTFRRMVEGPQQEG